MKVGLVLAGGGARGAYQIGVLKALDELNISKYIKVVSGTSIGALNSILFINGNMQYAEELWNTLTQEQILPIKEAELYFKKFILGFGTKNISFIKKYAPNLITPGKLSRDGIYNIINKIDLCDLMNNGIICFATCTQIPEMKVKYFKLNDYSEEDIKNILLASSAIPMLFDTIDIEGYKYFDGGIVENEPIQPVYGENCDLIIVVHLAKDKKIKRDMYPNVDIVEIMPSIIENDEFDGVLDFDSNTIKDKISLGYNDTINLLKPIINLGAYINTNCKQNNKSFIDKFKAKFTI